MCYLEGQSPHEAYKMEEPTAKKSSQKTILHTCGAINVISQTNMYYSFMEMRLTLYSHFLYDSIWKLYQKPRSDSALLEKTAIETEYVNRATFELLLLAYSEFCHLF
jgi:hypothetical protein